MNIRVDLKFKTEILNKSKYESPGVSNVVTPDWRPQLDK